MRSKIFKKVTLISAVVAAMLLVFMLWMFLQTSEPKAQAAAGTLYTAEYGGDNGTVDVRLNRQQIADKYGVKLAEVLDISTGEILYKFLNGDGYNYKVAYLTNDVGIAYNASKDGYYTVNANSSNAIFDKKLDGNGYTVNIYGGAGKANSTEEIKDDDGYRFTRRAGAARYARVDVWYEYTGYLVAQNYGIIANMTIDFTSPHTVIEAVNGHTGNGAGDLGIATANRLMSNREGLFVAGVVAGLNGYDGAIKNVRLNVRNAFTAIKMASNNTGYFTENSAYVGGIAGRIEDNSTIEDCWVDITSSAGVFAGAQGKPTNPITAATDNHYSMAIAGGLVGSIDSGTAKINYCVLSGGGQVKAFANRASRDERFQSFAGGIAGGCIMINGLGSIHDSNAGISIKQGQIKGIISSWTGSRFSNLKNSPKTIMGTLFDSVGSDDEIESVALLYDLETLMDNNPSTTKPISSDGRLVLDNAGNLRDWLAIYPTSAGGSMTVQFVTGNLDYDIRIHIVADGHEDFKNSGEMDQVVMNSSERFYQYKMQEGEGGGFIWSGTFSSTNDSSNHINLNLDDPIYAEIYMIKSTNTGRYNYEFGKMGTIAYNDTNGNNGNLVRAYDGSSLKLPTVTMTNIANFNTSVFSNENLWKITYVPSSGSANADVRLLQTYMPGTYSMRLETKLGDRVYGYYNEEQKILAWQPTSNYSFTILPGVLSFGDATMSTDGWQSSVTFELKMNSANDFDSVEFQRNGSFTEDSAKGFTPNSDGTGVLYTVTEGTGKNGTQYSFYAYKVDPITEEYVNVAVSESRTVRIDTEAPEVSEKEYFIIDNGIERPLTEEDLDEIQQNWTKKQIVVRYTVSDNGKSGIAIAASDPSYIENEMLDNGDYSVTVHIRDCASKNLVYTDARGNETIVDLQFNVDTVQPKLVFGGSSYETESGLSYCRENVTIRYKATFGMSGWIMYYSFETDADGNDIWVARQDQDQMQDSGTNKSFVIDWNMGDVKSGKKAKFKMKMVNIAGLYDEVLITGCPYPDNVIGEYIIWRRIADIYIDNNLNNVFLEVEGGNDISVADILASGEGAKYFDKMYDGTDEYEGKKEYKFYTDLSKLSDGDFYGDDKLGAIYSTAFYMSRPLISIGDNGKVPVELRYSTSNAGSVQLSVSVPLSGPDQYNYAIYFADLSQIDFDYDVEVENGKFWQSIDIDANISKRQVEIDLKDQDAIKKTYYYGDTIPDMIDVFVEATGETIPVSLTTDASATADISEYSVAGAAPNGYQNIEYTIVPGIITIVKRPVAVDLRFDDGEIGNIPTGVQAGTVHHITGTYEDVNGLVQPVVVKYFLNDEAVDALAGVGLYHYEISIANPNYTIDGQTSFKFNVAKGFLDIKTGLRVADYTEDEVHYNLIIPEEAKDLYSDSDIQIIYYRYFEGAAYDEISNVITGLYNRTPMTEVPTEIGIYHVEVSFVTANHDNFFQKEYEAGDLVITKARTQINVENVNLEYYYTADLFTFDLQDAITEVRSSSNNLLWSSSSNPEGVIKVLYNKSGKYVEVPTEKIPGEGWYDEVGSYRFKIEYSGTDNYKTSELIVNLVINKAELKNISFSAASYEHEYDGKVHLPVVNGLNNYMGLSVMYQLNSMRYNNLSDLKIMNAGEYSVTMYANKDGYEELECETKVVIKKAKMEGVSAESIDVAWDNKRHTVNLKGLKGNAEDGYYYEDGITPGGVAVAIISGDSNGNYYATDVNIDPVLGPTNYSGEIVLRAANYEDLTVKTYIMIRQIELQYTEIGKTLPYKMPSGMSLKEHKGYFVSGGTRVECELEYYKDGKLVSLDENDTLADGKYTVKIAIPNSNFYIDEYWKFEIGEINSKEISALGFVAIAAVVIILVAAVVTAVVVVKKRKNAGIE